MIILLLISVAVIGLFYVFYRHQQILKDRAYLMKEAIHNHEFTFHLPTKGLFFGEQALQESLNELGHEINQLMARNEVESWEKLTRVLTHEIMNTTTPIISISQAYLNNPDIQGSPYEEGIRAIYDASYGLSLFVDSYRKLAQLQHPVLQDVNLEKAVANIRVLYPALHWEIQIPSATSLYIDEKMFKQILINLIKNAQEAGATKIGIHWHKGELWVSNNGAIILPEVAREMFTPFFTTKKTGTGIGLSLSRQLMIRQGRNLRLSVIPLNGFHVSFIL